MRSFSLEVTDIGKEIRDTHKEHDFKQAEEVVFALEEDEREEFIRLLNNVADKISLPKE